MDFPIAFGRYLLLDHIATGGMAEVFRAKTFGVEGFERMVAIKRILSNLAYDADFLNMFIDEARIAVQLTHANIVQIYELGRHEEQHYIAMEYVFGRDLRQILEHFREEGRYIPLPAAAFIAARMCEGLDYAHRKTDPGGRPLGVVHRDVSPQNILVSFDGAVKITDFGIAKAKDRVSKTEAGVLKGKLGYMSPDQMRGLNIDQRSDIFSAGILLFEMVTGSRLFQGESDFSTMERVRAAKVPPPSKVNPRITPAFERVILKALTVERENRYQWASELKADLQQFLIDGTTIYDAQHLTAELEREFSHDIKLGMREIENLMRMKPPADFDAAGANAAAQKETLAGGPGNSDTIELGLGHPTEILDPSLLAAKLEAIRRPEAPIFEAPTVETPRPDLGFASQTEMSKVEPVPWLRPSPRQRQSGPLLLTAAGAVAVAAVVVALVFTSGRQGQSPIRYLRSTQALTTGTAPNSPHTGELPRGTRVEVLNWTEGFAAVRAPNGKIAYLPADSLSKTEPGPEPAVAPAPSPMPPTVTAPPAAGPAPEAEPRRKQFVRPMTPKRRVAPKAQWNLPQPPSDQWSLPENAKP